LTLVLSFTHSSILFPRHPQCVVEVIEEAEEGGNGIPEEESQADWNHITYHLNKPKLSHLSLDAILNHDHLTSEDDTETSIPQLYPRTDAPRALRRQRLVWNQRKHLSNPNSSEEEEECDGEDHEEEEEKGEFLSQRERIRQQQHLQQERSQQQHQLQQQQDSPSTDLSRETNPQQQHHSSSSDTSSNVSTDDEVPQCSQQRSSPYVPQPPQSILPIPPPSNRPKTSFLLRYKEIVSISDYDFSRRNIIIRVGAPIEFILDPSTPSHVEHVLEGRSVHSELCFMSEILQLPYSGKFVFLPEVAGEIFVTCQIYSDMTCRVVVINPPPAPLPPPSFTSASSGIYDSKRKLQQHAHTYSPRLPFINNKFSQSLSGSFPVPLNGSSSLPLLNEDPLPGDSQPLPPFSPNFQSAVNTSLPLSSTYLGLSEKLYIHSSGPLSISSSYGDANSVASSVLDSDDGPEDDLIYFNPNHPSSSALSAALERLQVPEASAGEDDFERFSPHSSFPFTPRYAPISLSSQLSLNLSPDAIVYVEDFKFQPSHLELQVGQTVLFQSSGHASMQKLSCSGEFEGIPLDSSENSPSSHFLFTFLNLGIFLVKNEIFSFMECEIVVTRCADSEPEPESESGEEDEEDTERSAIANEIRKFYEHLSYQSQPIAPSPSASVSVSSTTAPLRDGKLGRPIPLLGSFSAVSPKENRRNENTVDDLSLSPVHGKLTGSKNLSLMASVDWGLETEEFTDEDENEDAEEEEQHQQQHEESERPSLRNDEVDEVSVARRSSKSAGDYEKCFVVIETIPISPIVVPQSSSPYGQLPSPSQANPTPAITPVAPSASASAKESERESLMEESASKKKLRKNKKKKKRRKKPSSQSGREGLREKHEQEEDEDEEGEELEQIPEELPAETCSLNLHTKAEATEAEEEGQVYNSLSSPQGCSVLLPAAQPPSPISFLDPRSSPGSHSPDRPSSFSPAALLLVPQAHSSPLAVAAAATMTEAPVAIIFSSSLPPPWPSSSSSSSPPPNRENNLMSWLHTASAKKRSHVKHSQKVVPNSIDEFLFESLMCWPSLFSHLPCPSLPA
jgi:hypothetical protein